MKIPLQKVLLLLVLASGVWLRSGNLGSPPLKVDEAESSINALTILQHGYPVDHYLGMPIYENTLIRPWPESNEYEFKDLSYSDRGMAVYHGWLPLYAIAGSFSLLDIRPDEVTDRLRIGHGPEDFAHRTIAARIPAIAFSVALLLMLFVTANALYGRDAAWAALVAGAYLDSLVSLGRQARYYSATLALSTAAGFTIWRMLQRGKWRDFLAGGVVFVLLFHTHLLSFGILSMLLAVMSPLLLHHRRAIGKSMLFASITAAGTVPWAVWVALPEQTGLIPRAWPLLTLPADLVPYLADHKAYAALYGAGLLWWLGGALLRSRLPARMAPGIATDWRAPALLCAWIPIAALAFLLLIPAASFFVPRLSLVLLPPCLLLAALLFADVARAWKPQRNAVVAPVLLFLFLLGSGRIGHEGALQGGDGRTPALRAVIEYLRGIEFQPGSKLYATPNNHLPLTFYTGLPVQSIAPVRRSFLSAYEQEVVIFELSDYLIEDSDPLAWQSIRTAAAAAGDTLSETEAQRWADLLLSRIVREDVPPQVVVGDPPLEDFPAYMTHALQAQRDLVSMRREAMARSLAQSPMFRGYTVSTWTDWWQVFSYRFVDPESRRGPNLNYGDRLRQARAYTIPGTPWLLYRSSRDGILANGKHGPLAQVR